MHTIPDERIPSCILNSKDLQFKMILHSETTLLTRELTNIFRLFGEFKFPVGHKNFLNISKNSFTKIELPWSTTYSHF